MKGTDMLEPREHDKHCASLCDCQRHLDRPSTQPCYWNHFSHPCNCAELCAHEAACLTNCRYISDAFVETDSCVAGHENHRCNCDDVTRIAWVDVWQDQVRDHLPHCASLCDLPLFYVVSTGEYECDDHHTGHECTCDQLAQADAEPRDHYETCASLCEWAELDADDPDEECPSHMSHACNCADLAIDPPEIEAMFAGTGYYWWAFR